MGDYRVENFFLMQSPKQPLIITTTYLFLVLKIGPYFMSRTQKYDLIAIIRVYNVLQIIFNTYLFAMGLRVLPHFSIWCSPPEEGESETALHIIKLHHLFVLLKIFDLMETIFFVLRKKMDQVSFLHVFHHVGLIWITWTSCKYFPGGQGLMPAMLNTFVHVFMYIYYLQSSRGKIGNKLWKKCLTALQIGHQVLIFGLYILPLVNPKCSYPKFYLSLTLGYMIVIIYLFLRFYKDSYRIKDSTRS